MFVEIIRVICGWMTFGLQTFGAPPCNNPPWANDQSVSTDEDAARDIVLTAADDGDTVTYAIESGPSHGTLSGSAPNLRYTPAANYHGTDGFTFRANDGENQSNVGVVNITVLAVNDAPTAALSATPTSGDAPLTVNFNASSSSDVDGDAIASYQNLDGVVYLDRFVLQSSGSTANPASAPGETTNQSTSASGGETSSVTYQPPANAQSFSIFAESSMNVPFQLVLVNPNGLAVETVNASNGMATITQPVTQGGVYVIKVVNLNLGPLQFTTTVTPLVAR